MPKFTVRFFDGNSGAPADPGDIELELMKVGKKKRMKPDSMPDGNTIEYRIRPGVFVVLFKTKEKIVSFSQEEPGDTQVIAVDFHQAPSVLTCYVWDINPDESIPVPPPLPDPDDGDEGDVTPMVLCTYCYNRYTTYGSPYYGNTTWYYNCYYYPPCT